MALSLTFRKNLRDVEPKMNASIQKIRDATGVSFSFEVDWPPVIAALSDRNRESYGNRVGEIVADEYLGHLANGLASYCADEMKKEGVVSSCTAQKISFRIIPKTEWDYGSGSRIKVSDGVLYMETTPDNFNCLTSGVKEHMDKVFAGSGLPLAARVDIRDTEPERAGWMAEISKAAGHTYSFECNWESLTEPMAKRGFAERHGEIVNRHMKGAKTHLLRLLADDMGKEGFVEATPSRIIRFVVDAKAPKNMFSKIEDGAWVIVLKDTFIAYMDAETGSDVESIL